MYEMYVTKFSATFYFVRCNLQMRLHKSFAAASMLDRVPFLSYIRLKLMPGNFHVE